MGVYMAEYDKFRSLSDISGKLFDADGKELKSIRKKEILDVPVTDGESLVTDGRTKEFAFPYTTYPYTVEFEDEMTFRWYFLVARLDPDRSPAGICSEKCLYR